MTATKWCARCKCYTLHVWAWSVIQGCEVWTCNTRGEEEGER